MQYNEYTVVRRNFRNQRNICFDCDRDYIYVNRTQMNVNYIDLYTHDVQIIRTINPICESYHIDQAPRILSQCLPNNGRCGQFDTCTSIAINVVYVIAR